MIYFNANADPISGGLGLGGTPPHNGESRDAGECPCNPGDSRRPLVMEAYAGKQFVGIDLHRRRSVIVRTTECGDPLETVQISNDVESLARVDGWRRGGAGGGAGGHLRLVLGGGRSDRSGGGGASGTSVGCQGVCGVGSRTMCGMPPIWPTCCGWVGCRRRRWRHRPLGSCASWCGIGPSWSRCAPGCKCEVHAVLAKCGVQVLMSDLFGVEGTALLKRLRAPAPYLARVGSLRRLIDELDEEIDLFDGWSAAGWWPIRGTARCNASLGSARSWQRCSWPRLAMCTDSLARPN